MLELLIAAGVQRPCGPARRGRGRVVVEDEARGAGFDAIEVAQAGSFHEIAINPHRTVGAQERAARVQRDFEMSIVHRAVRVKRKASFGIRADGNSLGGDGYPAHADAA